MAGKFTDEGNKYLLELLLNINTPTIPANLYLGLGSGTFNSTSTLATITELGDATYTREEVTFSTPSLVFNTEANKNVMTALNTSEITFGAFTTSGAEVTHMFLTDSASGTSGNLIAYYVLSTPKYTNSGETFIVSAGDLVTANN